jgi:hypothetical protein
VFLLQLLPLLELLHQKRKVVRTLIHSGWQYSMLQPQRLQFKHMFSKTCTQSIMHKYFLCTRLRGFMVMEGLENVYLSA